VVSKRHRLVYAEDGTIQVGNFTFTSIGLIPGEAATFEEWQQVGGMLQRLDASIQWLIGDWFLCAETKWGQTYEQVAAATGYSEVTLKDYAYVARNVQLSVRTDQLTFGHHKLVTGLEPELQRQWLAFAVENKLSISQMREALGLSPTLSNDRGGELAKALDFPTKKRDFNKFLKLTHKAGQGDVKARRMALGYIAEQRKWLDEVERWLQYGE
jgi:hypothetical protein